MLQSTFEFDDRDTGKVVRIAGYYHDEYYGMSSPNNRIRFVNVLKNWSLPIFDFPQIRTSSNPPILTPIGMALATASPV